MENFWEKSPLYQRQQEMLAEFEAAMKTQDEAGKEALACVYAEIDTPRNSRWLEARRNYLDAQEACYEASKRWRGAYDAYKASPVGQAEARYWKDPLNRSPDFYAPTEFAEAAE